jgi:UDP-N-acetylmuramoylalanine--D-glutamate ligase
MARLLGAAPERLVEALPTVRALPHRLESLGRRLGVHVIDNGVSTTPDSTLAVFPSLPPGFTLIVGGKLKARRAADACGASSRSAPAVRRSPRPSSLAVSKRTP